VVKILLAIIASRQALILEVAGAAAVIYGVSQLAGWAGWVAAGAVLLLKSLEVDLRGDKEKSP
jgi:hypothetical protein